MKVTFMPGIEAISGASKSKNGRYIIFTRRQGDKPGQGRMYLRESDAYVRKTELSDNEKKARSLFAQRAEYATKLLRDRVCRTKKEAWQKAKQDIKS